MIGILVFIYLNILFGCVFVWFGVGKKVIKLFMFFVSILWIFFCLINFSVLIFV